MKLLARKTILGIILAMSFVSAPLMSFAADDMPKATPLTYVGKSTKFAVMAADVLHFKAALMTAEEMQVKKKKFQFEIVVVGTLAKALAEDSSLIEDINRSEALGVTIVICKNALTIFKAPKEKLDKRIKTTQNGWVYMFQLKDKNFNTLTI